MATTEEVAATTSATANAPSIAPIPAPMTLPRVPIPPRGVDYRGKLVLAPMVRSGELPSRLLALHYGADLVWGPETVDHSLIGAVRRVNPRTSMIEYTRQPSHSYSPANTHNENGNSVPESVIYRLDPTREKGKLIFQLGTADAARAVAAARFVAGDVAGIDVNAGCPKPFSVSGGMGAALLRTPEKLAGILEALVRDITPAYGLGVSVKIRLLETAAETEALVRRLVRTGITGLTVHCRTTPMRPRERAIRGQLRMVREVCHEAGVACLMNGDVESRDQADALVEEFGVDGAMIATAAERNPSCFRSGAEGGLATWQETTEKYLRYAMEVENKVANTKFLLAQMVPGKASVHRGLHKCRSYVEYVDTLGLEGMKEKARETDRLLKLGEFEVRPGPKQKNKNKGQQQLEQNDQESKKRKREEVKEEPAKRLEVAEPELESEQGLGPVAVAASVAVKSDTLGGSTNAPRSFRRWKSTSAIAVFSGSKQQHLAAPPREELLAQAGEPALPEGLCLAQVVVVALGVGFVPGRRTDANSVTTAPPREWPTRMMGGSEGQCMAAWVRVSTVRRSDARVVSDRSGVSSFPASPSPSPGTLDEVVVNPCPLASSDRIPAPGRRFLISAPSTAKDKPELPAPWCVTNSGPPGLPGPDAGAGEVR
ncbi:hypothetical protein CHGG_01523 [Chaetomium globosum CBS 148.51]|uniref:DUS-like FMN-binding domain-containing protein n=1 Tax=Chaetomium globosum (strain ATCC 6205 / CBS 148.51 / DSM 1962 / NBRC 6347 / NRRL 1970) TaxID=306901 RepID=Q2HE31_CHAGB|nr:uncharacterized protein CHGG_01523 [Chaetomium globosum CBS 148.51]EAQ93288.1 hypothetical protein CHGG_01523 [Chaetomium globosum CBS 148.51]